MAFRGLKKLNFSEPFYLTKKNLSSLTLSSKPSSFYQPSSSLLSSSSFRSFSFPYLQCFRQTNSVIDKLEKEGVPLSEREFEELTVEKYAKLIKCDKDRRAIENILGLYELAKYETGSVPQTIEVYQMKELLLSPSTNCISHFEALYRKELRKELKKHVKANKPKSETWSSIQTSLNDGKLPQLGVKFDKKTGAPVYGEWLNTHFIKIRRHDYIRSFAINLLAGHLFGSKLVLDCGYNYEIGEVRRVVDDVQAALIENRKSSDAFDIVFTSLTDPLLIGTMKGMLNAFNPDVELLGINKHKEPFTTVFPKEHLIYLSPHARMTVTTFDHDAVYILGAVANRTKSRSSFMRAQSMGIKCYRLPLDHCSFRPVLFPKYLSIRECVRILNFAKETGSFIKGVTQGINPIRLKSFEEIAVVQNNRAKKYHAVTKRLLLPEIN